MKTLHIAIIAGICASIAITAASLLSVELPFSSIHIEINGLKNKYQRGDPVDFLVNVTGYAPICDGPSVRILNAAGQVVWQGHYPAYTGMYCNPHAINLEFHPGGDSFAKSPANSPIILTEAGQYTVNATVGKISSQRQFSVINQLPKGSQVDLSDVSVWTCGAGRKIATFVDANGFANITKANEPVNGSPADWNDFFDFVSKPNSTGYIDMSFEFFGESYGVDNKQYNGSIQSSLHLLSNYGTISGAFNRTAIYALDDPHTPHINSLDGISIFSTNVENVTNHTLKLTYVIKVAPSAKEGTYGVAIPYTCPIELLTVGDHPYTGSVPWHRGIY